MTLKRTVPVHSTVSRAEWHGFKPQLGRLLAAQPWASCSPSLSLSLLLRRMGCCASYRPECHTLSPPTLPAPPPTFRDRTGAEFVSQSCSSQLVGGLAGQEDPRPAGDRGPGMCSSWIVACVLKSPRAAPGRLARAQQPDPASFVMQMAGSGFGPEHTVPSQGPKLLV